MRKLIESLGRLMEAKVMPVDIPSELDDALYSQPDASEFRGMVGLSGSAKSPEIKKFLSKLKTYTMDQVYDGVPKNSWTNSRPEFDEYVFLLNVKEKGPFPKGVYLISTEGNKYLKYWLKVK